jgi:hypothetical protein
MLKKIFQILKKIVFSMFLIYGYNLIAVPLGILVPLNILTVLYVAIFGVPALLSLIALIFFVF